jgi:2-dehydro-3-deoxyphosphooctonate aldolase (KDO 8-P synthase)
VEAAHSAHRCAYWSACRCSRTFTPKRRRPSLARSWTSWIPAFLCRQTDLLEAAAVTGKIVNVKKGQFLSPAEMGRVVKKSKVQVEKVLLTERGTTFGYNHLVADMRSIPIMEKFGCLVILTPRTPSNCPAAYDQSGGQRGAVLARAALAAGAHGIFMETHRAPTAR